MSKFRLGKQFPSNKTSPRQMEHFVRIGSNTNNNLQIKEPQGSKSLELLDLQEFWHRTKLTGFTQIGTRQSIRWKFFWIAVSIAGFFMSLYQSRYVIDDYFSERTIQIIGFQNAMKVPFPSLTVCSNVRWHYSKWNPEMSRLVCNSPHRKDCYRVDSSHNDRASGASAQNALEKRAMEALLRLQLEHNMTERYKNFHGNPLEAPFLKACYWKGFTCNTSDQNVVLFFNSLLHGLCLTINPGFNETMQGADYREFELVLDMDLLSRRLIFNDLFATVWVHKPGSSPALYSDNTGRVYPGDKARVEFVVKNVTRSKTKPCRALTDFKARALNVFYTENTPYLYQQSACMIYRENKLAKKKGCLHLGVPFQDFEHIINASKYTLCTSFACWSNCSNLSEQANKQIRHSCIGPCRDISIHYSIKTTSLLLETIVRSSMMLPTNTTESSIKGLGHQMRHEFVSIIQIAPINNIIEEIMEESKYSVSGLLGILGGNVGLWVGVSIISIAELIELVYLTIRLVIRQWRVKMGRVGAITN